MDVLGGADKRRPAVRALSTGGAAKPERVWPPAAYVAAMFAGGLFTGVTFTWLNVESLNYGVERTYARIDRAVDQTLVNTEKEYGRAVALALQGERLNPLDWVTVGTHLQKSLEIDYAANAYYLAYLASAGRVQAGRDWMHEALLNAPPEE